MPNEAFFTLFKFDKCIFVFSSRGGLRATAGGRLGWSTNNAQTLSKKPFSDWSLEVLCVWMDSLGLGMYNADSFIHSRGVITTKATKAAALVDF